MRESARDSANERERERERVCVHEREREREFLDGDCTLHVDRQQNRVPLPSSKKVNRKIKSRPNETQESKNF